MRCNSVRALIENNSHNKVHSYNSGLTSTPGSVFSNPNNPAFMMSCAGRIYLNPNNNREIYFNIGLASPGRQTYPMYENWLQPYVPESTYNRWMDAFKNELSNAPALPPDWLVGLYTMVSCGTWFCYNCYKQITFKNNSVKFNETIAVEETTHDVRLVLVCSRPILCQSVWVDSRGQPAHRMQPTYGGPPDGINIVLRLPNEIQWPPDRGIDKQPPVAVPPVLGIAQGGTGSYFSNAVHPQANIII